MTRVAQTVTLSTEASRERCVEALRRVFASKGGRVSTDDDVVVGRFGSQMLMHLVGGALMPASRVPVVARGAVEDAPGARYVTVEVDGDLGFATLMGWENKVRRRCESIAAELAGALAAELDADAGPGRHGPSGDGPGGHGGVSTE